MQSISEAEALSDILESGDLYSFDEMISDRNNLLKARYKRAKDKKVNEKFNCAYCDKENTKKQYSQAFCSPIKINNKKVSKCKDKYWNTIDENRWRNSRNINY